MLPVLLVALGGALGAVARFLVAGFFLRRAGADFPWGTLFINISGCVLIGAYFAYAGAHQGLHPNYRYLIPIGFIGGYTTFSAYALEVQRLIERGAFAWALFYLLASNALGLGAVFAGLWLGRRAS